ncbi:ATP-binding cassette domain-containing protein [Desulfobaculum bizertense]|uniref:ATP-binding cassette, subfamily F, member 3 n=1 Tax=Desulfobaculum bizertense DSM 18034 TaxID=1121442 RepID=A0A1T4VNX2_9BACT|nr:ATP-binding cassette domain-containing protein [Desulfobaculum bizertense]SKA66660.1 ATP-binding cassette, subfamily F, member 3 [Desulfobaculum bizertense DSM 18034]
MSRVSIQSLSKSFGGRDLFEAFSLEITPGMRLAVSGPNGCGKSTFIKILAGIEGADTGKVNMAKDVRLGYSMQELAPQDLKRTVLNFVLDVLPSWQEFWDKWDRATEAGDQNALNALSLEQAALEHTYGYNPEHKAKAVLSGLGFSEEKWNSTLEALSGGWRERAKLARILVAGADVLLLDEPTNHLDLEAVEWLEDYLRSFAGVIVFVAHDRVFLDRVATHVLFLGGNRAVLRPGTFSQFLSWYAETEEQRKREERRIAGEIGRKMDFVRRFQYKATKARQANSLKKQVAKMEKELEGVKNPLIKKQRELSFRWPEPARGNKTPLAVLNLSLSYGNGPRLWNDISFNVYDGQKIALAGPNGCGKSSLLKCIMGQLQPDTGRIEIGTNMVIGYYSQHQADTLQLDKSVIFEIHRLSDPRTSEEELRSVLGLFMLGEEFWERRVSELSGGEKNRLILATLFLKRANFLILDEPTNHLDLESREALIQALQDYTGTILMVAHDRHLLSEVAEQVWWLRPDRVQVFLDGYQGYDRARKDEAQLGQNGDSEADDEKKSARASLSRAEQKELKRRQAEARNVIYRELKPKKAAYTKLEEEFEAVLEEQGDVEQELADPSVYADVPRSTDLMKRFKELQDLSEKKMVELEELEAEIQELEARREELGGA